MGQMDSRSPIEASSNPIQNLHGQEAIVFFMGQIETGSPSEGSSSEVQPRPSSSLHWHLFNATPLRLPQLKNTIISDTIIQEYSYLLYTLVTEIVSPLLQSPLASITATLLLPFPQSKTYYHILSILYRLSYLVYSSN